MGLLSMCADIIGIAERISAMHWIADSGPGIGSQRCMYVCPSCFWNAINYPVTVCAWARGKVIGSILSVRCRHRHENHQISSSTYLCVLYVQRIDRYR